MLEPDLIILKETTCNCKLNNMLQQNVNILLCDEEISSKQAFMNISSLKSNITTILQGCQWLARLAS